MPTDQQILQLASQAFDEGEGIVRLTPTWVPRVFCIPGRRLRLHSSDLYAFGAHRGGIDERWLASTVKADNGPLTSEHEGLSFIAIDKQRVLLRDALTLLGTEILGEEAIARYGGWVMFSKFFDNMHPLPFHMHQNDERAADVGRVGKPEAYYFPAQYNFALDAFPYTFFGLEPGTTKDQVVDCLKRWDEGDNGILQLSKAYRLTTGTGWDVPTGILHAPGTLCTYEPQRASDVSSMWQSLIADFQVIDRSMLVKDVPEDKWEDYDYILSLLDWEANVDPQFKEQRFHTPIAARSEDEMRAEGYDERWIVYGSDFFSAKEVTVQPGRSVTLRDVGPMA
ncbi:hypothetical protein [Dictyobacter kobayashii]|uniref:Mannose-6-phosphate isomerase n=1 Tax=Dictyobacter kobayashii TaxID=2014872 RepID=A0A402AZ28_9CHLR|nr:hypothetical protein [Dictyobacter kobayashii]GCE24333.1 hypothetical protein KDK_81330 [Dictyobacter kobayashii]